jgi:hypothetical protein
MAAGQRGGRIRKVVRRRAQGQVWCIAARQRVAGKGNTARQIFALSPGATGPCTMRPAAGCSGTWMTASSATRAGGRGPGGRGRAGWISQAPKRVGGGKPAAGLLVYKKAETKCWGKRGTP